MDVSMPVTHPLMNLIKSVGSAIMVYWMRRHNVHHVHLLLGRGVIGNTPDFGSGDSRFDPWRPSHFSFAPYEGLQSPLTSSKLHFQNLTCQHRYVVTPTDDVNSCAHEPHSITAVVMFIASHEMVFI